MKEKKQEFFLSDTFIGADCTVKQLTSKRMDEFPD